MQRVAAGLVHAARLDRVGHRLRQGLYSHTYPCILVLLASLAYSGSYIRRLIIINNYNYYYYLFIIFWHLLPSSGGDRVDVQRGVVLLAEHAVGRRHVQHPPGLLGHRLRTCRYKQSVSS